MNKKDDFDDKKIFIFDTTIWPFWQHCRIGQMPYFGNFISAFNASNKELAG
jgi:hypothetical protein